VTATPLLIVGAPRRPGQNRQTYVLTIEPGGWRIAHCENVRVDAEAAKHDPVNGKKK
jgi:hypothetical protein